MKEYIIIVLSVVILIIDEFFNFMPKSIVGATLGILILSLLHVVIEDAVVGAIKKNT